MLNAFVFLLMFLIAALGQARAADIGECATPETMTAHLKAEGQRSIISAQRFVKDKPLRGMIFTMNADRSVGYILESDQPLSDKASKICVFNRLANVRLFDARKPGTPPEVLLKASDADASRRCDALAIEKKLIRADCGSLNTVIRKVEKWGQRVVIQGFTVDKQADGTYAPNGALATISGRIGGRITDYPDHPGMSIGGDIAYSALPEGATIMNTVLIYLEYTPYGLAELAKP